MRKVILDSNALPAHLDDRSRFAQWHEVFESVVCCLDLDYLSNLRFSAKVEFAAVDGLRITQMDGTVSRLGRTKTAIARGPGDDLYLGVNTGGAPLHISHVGRDIVIPRGGTGLFTNGATSEILTSSRNAWIGVTLSQERLRDVMRGAESLLARPLDQTRPVVKLFSNYLLSVLHVGDLGDDETLQRHVATTILDLVGLVLGAGGDAAAVARMRGLRAARAREILAAIGKGFAHPQFSSSDVARRIGVSRRYVDNLLSETGASFGERVLELRLQKARKMLADAQHGRMRVSEIAEMCGFNEVSHFNRRFRARFGCSPTQSRGAGREV